MSKRFNESRGNALIWVLVVVVILIGVYFVVKGTKSTTLPYNSNTYNSTYNTNTPGSGVQTSDDMSAEFNSASNEFDNIDVNGIDQGL